MKVAAAIGALLALVALPVIALGHASLVSSDPADGATISTPFTLEATFAEEIDPAQSTLIVENSAGAQVAAGTVDAADTTTMTAELPALPDGVYTVRWTTVTPDDNGVERGTFTFNVGSGNATPAPTHAPIVPGPKVESMDALIAIGLATVFLVIVLLATIRTVRGRR